MTKYSINLLQAELLPKTALLTLTRVLVLWCLAIVLMMAWMIHCQHSAEQLSKSLKQLTAVQSQQKVKMAELESAIKKNRADVALTEKLSTLKLVLTDKKDLHRQLTDSNHTSVAGFAPLMTDLAKIHHKDVSLHKIDIDFQDMTFVGVAKSPEAVPAWLAQFENSELLSGKSFVNFSLQENEQKFTEFIVSSKVAEEGQP